jgi:hypothetical protein
MTQSAEAFIAAANEAPSASLQPKLFHFSECVWLLLLLL